MTLRKSKILSTSAITKNYDPSLRSGQGLGSASGLATNRRFNGMKEKASLGRIYDFNARYGVYPERSEGTPRSGGS
jgi:hypothetical protein